MISGGSIGYRPLLAAGSTDAQVSQWVTSLKAMATAGRIPQQVADTAGDIYAMFFKAPFSTTDLSGSLFNVAPPIWQQVNMAFCADGTVKSIEAIPNSDTNPQYGLVE